MTGERRWRKVGSHVSQAVRKCDSPPMMSVRHHTLKGALLHFHQVVTMTEKLCFHQVVTMTEKLCPLINHPDPVLLLLHRHTAHVRGAQIASEAPEFRPEKHENKNSFRRLSPVKTFPVGREEEKKERKAGKSGTHSSHTIDVAFINGNSVIGWGPHTGNEGFSVGLDEGEPARGK